MEAFVRGNIAGGNTHSGFISQGYVFTFGNHESGQLGIGDKIYANNPTYLPKSYFNNESLLSVSSMIYHTLAITSILNLWFNNQIASGNLYSYGNNYIGQLGNGGFDTSGIPHLVNKSFFENETIAMAIASNGFSVVLTSNFSLYLTLRFWDCIFVRNQ